jgi:biotin transporter BioY
MTYWGFAMGLPSFATLAGGANWLFGGLAGVVFAAMLSWALLKKEKSWIKEWSLLAIVLLFGAPSFYLLFPFFASLGMPDWCVARGDLYRLASYGQWFSLMGVFVYSAYSAATQERFAK